MASAGSVFVDLLLRDGQFVRGMNNARRTTDSAVGAITSRLAGLAVALTAGLSVSKILEINDTFTMLESRLRLVQTGAVGASEALNRLYSISQENRQPLQESIAGYVRLAQSLTTYQRAQYDVIEISSLLAQTLKVSGTEAAGAASFYMQFGQAASSDFKAIGQELQTFADQNPVFYGLIRDEVAKTGQTLKQFAADGKLSFDFVAKVLTENADTIRAQALSMATTVGQAGTVISNSFQNYIRLSPDVDFASRLIRNGLLDIGDAFDYARKNNINFTTAIGGLIGGYYKLNIAAEKLKLATYSPLMSDAEVQKQRNHIAGLIEDYEALGDVLNERNNPLPEARATDPASVLPPVLPATDPASVLPPVLPPSEDQKKSVQAVKDMIAALTQQRDTLGQSEEEIMRYRIAQGDLAEALKETGSSASIYAGQLIELTADLEQGKAVQSIQDMIDALREQNAIYGKSAAEALRYKIEQGSLSESFLLAGESANALKEELIALTEENTRITEQWGFDIEALSKRAAENIQDSFADFLFDPFADGLSGMLEGFSTMIRKMAAEALAAQIMSGLFGDVKGGGGGVSSILGALANFVPSFDVGSYRVPGDMVANIHKDEMIIPAAEARQIRSGGGIGGGTVINQYISTPDANSFNASKAQVARNIRRGIQTA